MAIINEVAFPDLKKEEHSSCLTELEKKNPQRVLADFFDLSTIDEVKENLREWLFASFKANNGEQFTYIHLWQQLERLLEANWLLNQTGFAAGTSNEEA